MASAIPDGGGGDMCGGEGGNHGGGGGTSLDGVGSFSEVDNWFGSSNYATQAGLQQSEAPLIQSSSVLGCSMGCSLADQKWDIWFHFEGRNPVKREVYHHVKVVNIKVVRDVQPAISAHANENYMNTQESCSVKKVVEQSELQNQINDRKAQLERSRIQREADLNHFEGDTEVFEFCSDDLVHYDGSAEAVQMEIECASKEDRALELTAVVKCVNNLGPTSRCHDEVEHKQIQDWFPEADEFCLAGDLGISDEEEEDEVELPYLVKKPKSNKKKMKDRRSTKGFSYKDFEVISLPQELPNKNYCLVFTERAWM
ncbi:hypothetical protein D1007_12812 [Hordeum vulgare]|nr:hypothetical protein D1007_12812 [Hordeum vulgare]